MKKLTKRQERFMDALAPILFKRNLEATEAAWLELYPPKKESKMMPLTQEDLDGAALPHRRFPEAVRERRYVLVAVAEVVIADLVTEGMEGREFRSTVEGLPDDAVVCGVYHNPDTACMMLRFVHPDLASVDVGRPIILLEGTIEILDRPAQEGLEDFS